MYMYIHIYRSLNTIHSDIIYIVYVYTLCVFYVSAFIIFFHLNIIEIYASNVFYVGQWVSYYLVIKSVK